MFSFLQSLISVDFKKCKMKCLSRIVCKLQCLFFVYLCMCLIYVVYTGDCWLGLTSNTVAFSKLYLTLLEDCLRLATPELLYTVDEVLGGVFQAQILHVEASLSSDKYKAEV